MKKHVHKWKKTGDCRYTDPLQYAAKCKCGKTKWLEEAKGIKKIAMTDEEMRKKYPQHFKDLPQDNC